ncbi:MAG: MobA-like NTP transferase domain containing protein [Planctomycetota bacterium]|nr:MAG: MobA-like NTP transferase domain containing protein [Planctomycetota bacterium]
MTAGFTAIVLAGDRGAGDPVARAAGSSCKALASVGGRPMVLRVIDALRASEAVASVLLVGPERSRLEGCEELRELVAAGTVRWMATAASPAASAFAALEAIPASTPVLLTTADHALLDAAMVDHFCAAARASGRDVVAGVAAHEAVVAACPGVRRTALRLAGESICGCNLFAFLTPNGRDVADFWRRVEAHRKRPLRVVGILGWRAVLRYALGRLSLAEALAHLSRLTGRDLGVVRMPFPEAAVDVDTPEDLAYVRARLAGERTLGG